MESEYARPGLGIGIKIAIGVILLGGLGIGTYFIVQAAKPKSAAQITAATDAEAAQIAAQKLASETALAAAAKAALEASAATTQVAVDKAIAVAKLCDKTSPIVDPGYPDEHDYLRDYKKKGIDYPPRGYYNFGEEGCRYCRAVGGPKDIFWACDNKKTGNVYERISHLSSIFNAANMA